MSRRPISSLDLEVILSPRIHNNEELKEIYNNEEVKDSKISPPIVSGRNPLISMHADVLVGVLREAFNAGIRRSVTISDVVNNVMSEQELLFTDFNSFISDIRNKYKLF